MSLDSNEFYNYKICCGNTIDMTYSYKNIPINVDNKFKNIDYYFHYRDYFISFLKNN